MTYLEKVIKFNEYMITTMPHYLADYQKVPKDVFDQRRFMRALMNVTQPLVLPRPIENIQNSILQEDLEKKGTITIADMEDKGNGIYLFQGDITRIETGAIVNAANNQMLGCFTPLHDCIDNIIHSAAGVQLRYACNTIEKIQGHPENTGEAKITKAYNLPCDYVLHTVGPIVAGGHLTKYHEQLLENCYVSCVKLAAEYQIKSIAFCCISTGVFGFPQQEAAEIAVRTIKRLQKEYPLTVIFNVFTDADKDIYEALLG